MSAGVREVIRRQLCTTCGAEPGTYCGDNALKTEHATRYQAAVAAGDLPLVDPNPPRRARPLQEVLEEHVDQVRAQREVDQENAARSAALQQNAAVDRRIAELRAGR